MAKSRLIEIPDFDFSGFYYPDILRSLTQFQKGKSLSVEDNIMGEMARSAARRLDSDLIAGMDLAPVHSRCETAVFRDFNAERLG